VKDKFKLMEYFTDLPHDARSLVACKMNPSVLSWLQSRVDEAGEESTEGAKSWKLWLAILWLDYSNLPKNVRDQVLEATKKIVSKARHQASFISCIMATEKGRYQQNLDEHKAWSLEGEAERLRARVNDLDENIGKFAEVVGKRGD